MVKKAIQKFEIALDKQPSVYYVGETISGHIRLELKKLVKIKSIQANLFGRSNTVIEIRSNNHSYYIRKHETFIEKALLLWGDSKQFYFHINCIIRTFPIYLADRFPSYYNIYL